VISRDSSTYRDRELSFFPLAENSRERHDYAKTISDRFVHVNFIAGEL